MECDWSQEDYEVLGEATAEAGLGAGSWTAAAKELSQEKVEAE